MKPLFRTTTQRQTHSRSGIAFIIEMLILLVLVCGCFAVLVQLFAYSEQQGKNNYNRVEAVHLAADVAEAFGADPQSVPEVEVVGNLVVYTTIIDEPQATGTLYTATISVYNIDASSSDEASEPYCELETARYVRLGES